MAQNDTWLPWIITGVLGSALVYIAWRALSNSVQQQAGLFSVSGSTINNSTIIMDPWGTHAAQNAPIVPYSPPAIAPIAQLRKPVPVHNTPLANWTSRGVTRTNTWTMDATARLLVGRRGHDADVTVTNNSNANVLRVGSQAEVEQGEGATIPPGSVVRFRMREQTDLWGSATGSVPAGVIVSDVD